MSRYQTERRTYHPAPAGEVDEYGNTLYTVCFASNTQGFVCDADAFIQICPPTTHAEALRRAQELTNDFNHS